MAEKKKTIMEYGISFFSEFLKEKLGLNEPAGQGQAKKLNLDDLPLDDLRREKIRLEQEERKMLARLKDVEKQKRHLFEDGVRNAGEREQRVIARRIKELDVEANNMDRILQMISKQMRVLNGLVQLKERGRMATESGLTGILNSIDLQDLIIYIDKASVDGEFNMEKFNDVLNALEEADGISPEYHEDQDVLDIMRAMQQARESMDSPETIDERFSEMNRKMEQKSQADLEASEAEF